MSQPTFNTDFHLCDTPPPSKTPPAALRLANFDYATLNSSPVTPYSTPSVASSQLRPPTEAEAERYTQMLLGAKRHSSFNTVLVKHILTVGNGLYVDKRSIIICWLIDVCRSFMFKPQTLHAAVRHMDWFMALHGLDQGSWQLCAVAAVFLAAKCEEAGNRVPVLENLKSICEHIYDDESIRRMELCMLAVLKWDLVVKTPVHFLHYLRDVISNAVKDREEEQKRMRLVQGRLEFSPCRENATMQGDTYNIFDTEDLQDEDYYPSDMEECDCFEECTCDDSCSEGEAEPRMFAEAEALGQTEMDTLACDEEMSVDLEETPMQTPAGSKSNGAPKSGRVESTRDVIDDLMGIAECVLDSSLFDISVMSRFEPHVIATSALLVAIEASGETRISSKDVRSMVDLWEKETSECCRVLFQLFEESYEKGTL